MLRILRRVERAVGVSLRLVSLVSAPLGVSLGRRLGCLGRHCVHSSLHLRLSVKGVTRDIAALLRLTALFGQPRHAGLTEVAGPYQLR